MQDEVLGLQTLIERSESVKLSNVVINNKAAMVSTPFTKHFSLCNASYDPPMQKGDPHFELQSYSVTYD